MRINLLHNKIVMDTVTDKFIESFNVNLIPKLQERFPAADEVVLYEDYLTDGFTAGGVFYCPLTVVSGGEASFVFAAWRVDAKRFENSVPYSYRGSELLDFVLPDNIPSGFRERLDDRTPKSPEEHIAFRIDATVPDKTFLSGKYSESFIDLLAKALTEEIEREFRISGTKDSTLELHLGFSPVSFMEHIADGITYRRLGISAKACSVRDIWVKWYRADGKRVSIADHIKECEVIFEIPDDVPEKIREKEYRYLVSQGSPSAYKNAMSRKNFTEWRELVKRVIKRGEVEEADLIEAPLPSASPEKTENEAPVSIFSVVEETSLPENTEFKLDGDLPQVSLSMSPVFDIPEDDEETEDINPDITELLRGIIGGAKEPSAEDNEANAEDIPFEPTGLAVSAPQEEEEASLEEELSEDNRPPFDIDDEYEDESEDGGELSEEEYPEESAESDEEETDLATLLASLDGDASEIEEALSEDESYLESEDEEISEEHELEIYPEEEPSCEESSEEEAEPIVEPIEQPSEYRTVSASVLDDFDYDNRRESEMERLQSEIAELKASLSLAKAECAEKDSEQESLKSEIASLKRENEKMKAEISAYRDTMEALKRAEDREREKLAELAKAAIEEQKNRSADVDIEREREAARLEKERLEAEAREAAEREAKAREEAERLAREEEARAAAELAKQEAAAIIPDISYNEPVRYISKTADIIFAHSVDPNITKRIQSIITETVEYFNKGDIYMKIRATIPEHNIVRLEFLKFPENEYALLTDIIRVLGHSRIGITKVLLD